MTAGLGALGFDPLGSAMKSNPIVIADRHLTKVGKSLAEIEKQR
jgi:hypothetical protein